MSNYSFVIYNVNNSEDNTVSLTVVSELYLSTNELRTISKSLTTVSASEIDISINIKSLFIDVIQSDYDLFGIHRSANQAINDKFIPFTQLSLLRQPPDNDNDSETIIMVFEDKIDDRDNLISYDINNLARFFGSLPYYPNCKTSFDVCTKNQELLRFEITNIDS